VPQDYWPVLTADIDGFKLLEIIGLEMDIPVISALFLPLTAASPWLPATALLSQLPFNKLQLKQLHSTAVLW
jgi:hypothetical protein